eukprot:6468043-Amphidinium_carterae.1
MTHVQCGQRIDILQDIAHLLVFNMLTHSAQEWKDGEELADEGNWDGEWEEGELDEYGDEWDED